VGYPPPAYPPPYGQSAGAHAGVASQERLDGQGRLRRALLLAATGVAVVAGLRLAPYVTYLTVLALVVLLRGAARSQESLWRRRAFRGRRWSDAPRTAVAFPWHTLVTATVSAVNVLAAAVGTAFVVAVLVLGGTRGRDALVVGGVVTVFAVWWGPGARRVRLLVGRGATALARRSPVGWTAVTLAVAVAAGLVVSALTGGVEWWPSDSPPWSQLEGLLPQAFLGQI
jgi:hypothetical protein